MVTTTPSEGCFNSAEDNICDADNIIKHLGEVFSLPWSIFCANTNVAAKTTNIAETKTADAKTTNTRNKRTFTARHVDNDEAPLAEQRRPYVAKKATKHAVRKSIELTQTKNREMDKPWRK